MLLTFPVDIIFVGIKSQSDVSKKSGLKKIPIIFRYAVFDDLISPLLQYRNRVAQISVMIFEIVV